MNRVGQTIALIFLGCCSNVVFLELIVRPYPGSGNIVTFAQFLFIAIEGFINYYKCGSAQRHVPIKDYGILVLMFFLVSVINNYALNFNIPMPLHMIFRSGSLIANLILGMIILKKRYSLRQILAVLLITFGIVLATFASSQSLNKQKAAKNINIDEAQPDFFRWLIGISMLVFALLVSALMGIYQETLYAKYGKHPEEALFYSHLLPLPLFSFVGKDIYRHAQIFNHSTWLPIFSNVGVPIMWAYLFCNVLTQYFCIRSVFILTTECPSLVVTLVITLRKFISLIFSIIYFQNDFTLNHWIGTASVFLGTFLFSNIHNEIFRYFRKPKIDHILFELVILLLLFNRMTQINAIDTGHEELIHDAQLDYYGIRLATCSSDKSIKIFDVSNNQQRLIAELKGHDGPVWQLSWSHPTFGSLLASCSYDKKVLIWKETTPTGLPSQPNTSGGTQYSIIYEYDRHTSSVNTVAWAPYEYGLMLACGSSDGSISILSSTGDGRWTIKKVPDCHPPGVNALSWAPAVLPQSSDDAGVQGTSGEPVKRFVSGGCDNAIRIWKEQDDGWVEETHLDQHNDWVRDVAWAPTFSFHKDKIASCSQDGHVYVFTRDTRSSLNWECIPIGTHFNDVWSVSWSLTGDILAVAASDKVSLWKVGLDGKYQCLTTPQTSATSTGSPSVNSTMDSTIGDAGNIPLMAT